MSDIDRRAADALQALLAAAGLDVDPCADVELAVRTDSERLQRGILDRLRGVGSSQTLFAWLTPTWLFTVTTDPKSGEPLPLAHRLEGASVVDFEKTQAFKLIPDSGIEVTAFGPSSTERRSYFVPLQDNPAGDAFRAAVRSAAA